MCGIPALQVAEDSRVFEHIQPGVRPVLSRVLPDAAGGRLNRKEPAGRGTVTQPCAVSTEAAPNRFVFCLTRVMECRRIANRAVSLDRLPAPRIRNDLSI